MRVLNQLHQLLFFSFLFILLFINPALSQDLSAPFLVKDDLYNHNIINTLGLSFADSVETISIYKPNDETNKYNHGAVLISFKGMLYAQWQSSAKDKDAPDTWIAYSTSSDGLNWTSPKKLFNGRENCFCTNGGWWTDGHVLIAYLNAWPKIKNSCDGFVEYISSKDGINWSDPKPITDKNNLPLKGIFEQDPHALPNGRIITAIHLNPGMIASPFYTDDPRGITGWTKGIINNLEYGGNTSREIEPSWFLQNDGNLVMIFRDQSNSFKKLASQSSDNGETWTKPALINMPDSSSKQCAGNLPDGTAFMVNNPTNSKDRFPLAITLSKDGKYFDKAYLLRAGGDDLQKMKYEGLYKRSGYSYPKAYIWNDYLYVSYATNKEDIEITRVPLSSLIY